MSRIERDYMIDSQDFENLTDKTVQKANSLIEDMWRRLGYFEFHMMLQSSGFNVRLLDSINHPERLETGGTRNDMNYIMVQGMNFDMIAIRGSPDSGHRSYHFIVNIDPTNNPKDFQVRLKSKTKGLFSKQIIGTEWEGGKLASLISSHQEIARFFEGLVSERELSVKPDNKFKAVRIIITGMNRGMHDRGFPSIDMIYKINEIAGLVRQV